MKDPIVEEVRRARAKIAARHNYDIRAILADVRDREKDSGHPLVSFVGKGKKNKNG